VTGIGDIVVTKVRALLKPNPMKEIRVEKAFVPVKSVTAACGIKIAAPELEKVAAGSPLRAVRDERRVAEVKKEIEQEVSEVKIDTQGDGVLIKADTLGSLEALIKTLQEAGVPIRKAEIGTITRQDITEMKTIKKPIIFTFNVKVGQEMEAAAKDNNIKVFSSDVIYRLLEGYEQWEKDSKKRKEEDMLSTVGRPGRVKILPGYVFRQSKPAIVGVEVMKGIIKSGRKLQKDGETIGEIKEIQSQGENVHEAKAGDKVALSIDGAVVGRNVDEGDELDIRLFESDLEVLAKLRHRLRGDELELLDEMEKAKGKR
jgi:translation initiation factor 5B